MLEKVQIEIRMMTKAENELNKNINNIMKNEACIDPNPEQLSKDLLEMNFLFKESLGILDLISIQLLYKEYIYNDSLSIKHEIPININIDAIDCNKQQKKTVVRLKELELCPSYQVEQLRENMYPSIKVIKKCSCPYCMKMNENSKVPDTDKVDKLDADVEYSCQPVTILTPALIRSECVNGVYKWKPILERTSVACICSQNKPVITFTLP